MQVRPGIFEHDSVKTDVRKILVFLRFWPKFYKLITLESQNVLYQINLDLVKYK